MAGTIPADMTVQQWDDQYFEDFVNKDWWKKFTSTGSDSMICTKEELIDKPGTKIHIPLVNELSSAALGENDLYEGNEKSMTLRDFPIEVHEYGLPVKYKNFEAKKSAVELREVYKSGLRTWNMKLQRDKILAAMHSVYDSNGITYKFSNDGDANKFSNLPIAPNAVRDQWLVWNSDRVLFGAALSNNTGNMVTSLANVSNATGKITPDLVDQMKFIGEHPGAGKPRIKPLMPRTDIDEQHGFVLFVDDLLLRDIRANTAFQTANREARLRGIDNPIFSGANYIYNNVAIYSIPEFAPLKGVGAAAADVGRACLCGAQAIGTVWGKRPWTVDKKLDYDRFSGMAIMQWYEVEKLRWGTDPASDKGSPVDHGIVHGFFNASAYA